ncbi:uncharacterized protein Z520_02278 [Fonsecaea multimorphosa CBS 102226]|uniref:Uncharacterized protein n=1 Tax=Fonsecaea multimorphosa CBS 102226 TaxID=1442371 RepID=A0A0D2KFC1_9EURO|nr:uncharacterized protein Z520_02278 [Fonsecaea multimorphosa CBS 102226]KIY02140.1 hypothetical protein Z520_02278 [Fonsecaea multimorphosa CBS 102226]OAL29335.1 hypothetical protein AYO22_02229 [Fonsecaea multimorphosa]
MLAADYHVGWISALPLEEAAALDMLDERHGNIQQATHDTNNYILGRIGPHNVVIACLPQGVIGPVSAASVAIPMRATFPSLKFILLVGIGGGVPTAQHDIRLGDVVVSRPTGQFGGVVQYDFGKTLHQGHFVRTGSLNRPPDLLLNAVSSLEAQHLSQGGSQISAILEDVVRRNPRRGKACRYPNADKDELFESSYAHQISESALCKACDRGRLVNRPRRHGTHPAIHYGLIASGSQVIRDSIMRERLSAELDVLCFEMEAAGLMNYFDCLVIRGICDYSDSHKNKRWQEYAAATAAAYAKELLWMIHPPASFQQIMPDRTSGDRGGISAQYIQEDSFQEGHASGFDARFPTATRFHSAADESACLRSLWFREMGGRRDNIDRAAEGTCSWLAEHPDYQRWASQNHGFLWITGNPGSGKSVLLDTLVSRVDSLRDKKVIVASFFIHGRGTQIQKSPVGLYRSILHQILTKAEILLTELTSTFVLNQQNQGEYGHAWAWHEKGLFDFLHDRVKRYARHSIKIFIDALDECGEETARKLSAELWSLTTPTSGSQSAISVCITCRHYPVMDLYGAPEICVETQNSGDIARFVQGRLALVFKNKDSRGDVETEILRKAAGNFLWTALILEQTTRKGRHGYSLGKIRKEIQNSSPELSQIYKDALTKIPPEDRMDAMHLFEWVCLAEEPLSPVQMRYAMAFDPLAPVRTIAAWEDSETFYETDGQTETLIKAISGGLVEIVEGGGIIQCIHQSVKDYLLQQGLEDLESSISQEPSSSGLGSILSQAHELIFKCCMHYILTDEILRLPVKEEEVPKDQYPLIQYAVSRWPTHLKKADLDGRLQRELLTYFEWPSRTRLDQWLSLCCLDSRACVLPPGAHLLHLAGYYNLCHVIDAVFDNNPYDEVDARDANGCTPLIWAAKNGHAEATKCFVRRGADVNSFDAQRHSSLWWALNRGHLEVAEILVQQGADVNLQDEAGRTALFWASYNQDEASVDFLLSRNANPNIKNSQGRSPLHASHAYWQSRGEMLRRSHAIARKLLEKGAQPSKESSEGEVLLQWALRLNMHDIIDLILKVDQFAHDASRRALAFLQALHTRNLSAAFKFANAGINAQRFTDFSGETPIAYVLGMNCQAIAEVLLEKKNCDPNGRGSRGITPLIATAQRGLVVMMKSLITLGAEVDLADFETRTALSFAAEGGYLDAARLLIETHADLNLSDKKGKTPLMWAAEHGHAHVVDLLVQKGANLEAQDSLECSVLFWAARGGKSAVMKSLGGVDKEHRNSLGQTALWWAIMHHQIDAARCLLVSGANANPTDRDGSSLLLCTVSIGYLAGAQLLLEHGADANAKGHKQQTALLVATTNGSIEMIRLLLRYQANPDEEGFDGYTPLLLAVKKNLVIAVAVLCEVSQLNRGDHNRRTPLLSSAVTNGNETVAKCLLEHGVDANCRDNRGRTPLSFACEYGYESLVRILLEYRVDIDAQDQDGRTALWWAAAYGRTAILKTLLERRTEMEVLAELDESALLKAVDNGHVEAARLLLQHMFAARSDPKFSSRLLGLATDNSDPAMVSMLIQEGVDCSRTLPSGRTLLSWAAKTGCLDVLKTLDSHGIDLEAPCDQQGLTALDLAFQRRHMNVVEFLMGYSK